MATIAKLVAPLSAATERPRAVAVAGSEGEAAPLGVGERALIGGQFQCNVVSAAGLGGHL